MLPVFYDKTGWRNTFASIFNFAAIAVLTAILVILPASIAMTPRLPALKPAAPARSLSGLADTQSTSTPTIASGTGHAARSIGRAYSGRRYGFVVNWDENSASALKAHAHQLDTAVVEWLHLDGGEGSVKLDDPRQQQRIKEWVAASATHLELLPLINNYDAAAKTFDSEGTARLLASPAARARLIDALVDYIIRGHYPGMVLDFQELPASAALDYVVLAQEARARLQASGLKLFVSVPADATDFPYKAMGETADGVFLNVYDQNSESGPAGPIASQPWFETMLDRRSEEIDADKLVVTIGSFGYDWGKDDKAREISVQEAWELLDESHAALSFDPMTLNPSFGYLDDSRGESHRVWYLDAVTAYNQIAAAVRKRPAGLALWRLGTEDASIWAALAKDRNADDTALRELEMLNYGYDVLYIGTGEVLKVADRLAPGRREYHYDARTNLVTHQAILSFPVGTTVERWGARGDKVIALTFDDGPNPTYTPQVLDILKEKDAPATFFIVGSVAARHNDLLKRIYAEGHDIGNHTFTHVNSSSASSEQFTMELNATQRLLESIIGVRTTLFRPPYAQDVEPTTIDGARALRTAAGLGYLTIGMRIDPKDWARPSVEAIVESTVKSALAGEGNIVLLHDSGGDRGPTLKALPQIIDRLRAEGFRFVAVHELLNMKRGAIMPPADASQDIVSSINGVAFSGYSGIAFTLELFFQVAIILGIARIILVAVGAVVHAWREWRKRDKAYRPPSFAVIVPAYNEAEVICKTIQSLLMSRYRKFEILVIDDGSKDGTADIAAAQFARTKRVRVIRKPNGGKSSALNLGLRLTKADIVVALDADTIFEKDALKWLLRHFDDPKVGAVAGATIVGNCVNFITAFQALEYVTSQNMDRRALELVNGITVVPGAIGAWRREALLAVGGFSHQTLAEDADATIKIERAGYKVLYEPRAVARTESPDTVDGFMKQRFRWTFGTLQVAFKHADAIGNLRARGVGLFGLPNILLFQFLFTLIAPAVDLMLVWSLGTGLYAMAQDPNGAVPPALWRVAEYWAMFQLVDFAGAALALKLEHYSKLWRLLPLLLIQRFCYRQLLYISAWRSTASAICGHIQGWNKLKRSGGVQLEAGPRQLAPA